MKSTSLVKLKSGKAPKGAQHSRTCKNGIIKQALQKLSTSKTVSDQDVKAEFRRGGKSTPFGTVFIHRGRKEF